MASELPSDKVTFLNVGGARILNPATEPSRERLLPRLSQEEKDFIEEKKKEVTSDIDLSIPEEPLIEATKKRVTKARKLTPYSLRPYPKNS